jgi:hypothetical protein
VRTSGLLLTLVLVLAGCSSGPGQESDDDGEGAEAPASGPPARITLVPDDYHVPYAGTAEDGRRFFLSEELFDEKSSYVGLFLWTSDGVFDEVRVDPTGRPEGLPAQQAAPAGAEELVAARLAELGDYVLEPIEVEPFLEKVDGVEFGWRVDEFDGDYSVNVEPGNFIAYYAPWDGLDYDT